MLSARAAHRKQKSGVGYRRVFKRKHTLRVDASRAFESAIPPSCVGETYSRLRTIVSSSSNSTNPSPSTSEWSNASRSVRIRRQRSVRLPSSGSQCDVIIRTNSSKTRTPSSPTLCSRWTCSSSPYPVLKWVGLLCVRCPNNKLAFACAVRTTRLLLLRVGDSEPTTLADGSCVASMYAMSFCASRRGWFSRPTNTAKPVPCVAISP